MKKQYFLGVIFGFFLGSVEVRPMEQFAWNAAWNVAKAGCIFGGTIYALCALKYFCWDRLAELLNEEEETELPKEPDHDLAQPPEPDNSITSDSASDLKKTN